MRLYIFLQRKICTIAYYLCCVVQLWYKLRKGVTTTMLKRKALSKLKMWKEKNNKKSLIVTGARQVGKTYIIREFGKEFESFIELNFLQQPELCRIFKGSLTVESILMGIRLSIPESKIIEGNTLIFFDEIQECPEAITALKFLAQDSRILTVASGSALGMAYNRVTSFPVGYVDYLDMYSLDFEEFLWAMNVEEDIIAHVKDCFEKLAPVEDIIHDKFMHYFRQYMVLGGMPEVLSVFFDEMDYRMANEVQKNIYRDYLADIARFAKPSEKIKAEMCYRSIPAQLMKDNHKFQYGIVEKKGTARKYESSVDWLESAHMATIVTNVGYVEYPLQSHEITDNIRLYPSDIGLLICTFDFSIIQAILGDENDDTNHIILKTAKGGLYEALIADVLIKSGHSKLHFFRNEAGTAEMEYLLEGKDGVIPVEVKAGRKKARTLDNLLKKEDIVRGYKLANQNIGIADKKVTIPLYMAMWL